MLLGNLAAQQAAHLLYLEDYYSKAFEKWDIPGMAIAIVQDNKIVFEKGYGYGNLELTQPVDSSTLFAVASNTKSFTASAIAKLVEQGRLNWNDKVQKHLPWFAMNDPWISRQMTVEDLLSHRSGLKTFSGDLLWFGTDKTAAEVVSALQKLEPTLDFRAEYGYSNIMYIAAGLIIEAVSDTSYSDYIRHHFLNPLGMDRTLTSVQELEQKENVASPYYLQNDSYQPLEWSNWDNVVAAGGLISSVHDMAKWLILNINRGKFENQVFFSESSFEKMTTPHINLPISSFTRKNQPSKHFRGYGLGWSLNDYHGMKILSHGGGYDGMISKTCVVPEANLGIVILTNSLNYLPGALIEKTLDVLLAQNTSGLDYADRYLQSFKYNQEQKEQIFLRFEETREKINPNHLPLQSYTGIYRDDMYGDVEILLTNNRLHFDMKPSLIFKAPLEHWNDHIFTFQFDPNLSSLPPGKLWFKLNKDGVPETLLIDITNPDFDFREFSFVKVPD